MNRKKRSTYNHNPLSLYFPVEGQKIIGLLWTRTVEFNTALHQILSPTLLWFTDLEYSQNENINTYIFYSYCVFKLCVYYLHWWWFVIYFYDLLYLFSNFTLLSLIERRLDKDSVLLCIVMLNVMNQWCLTWKCNLKNIYSISVLAWNSRIDISIGLKQMYFIYCVSIVFFSLGMEEYPSLCAILVRLPRLLYLSPIHREL